MEGNKCDLLCDRQGEQSTFHNLNTGEIDILRFRFDFPVQTLCQHHFHHHFTLYPLGQKKCSDPCVRHSKPVKLRLSEISVDLANKVEKLTEHRVIPGQKICRPCAAHLSDVISSNEEAAVENAPTTDVVDDQVFDTPEFDSPM